MLLIVGSHLYEEPWRLAEHWTGHEVAVLTPADLSEPGWALRPCKPGTGRIVVNGTRLREPDIEGIVTTLPWVSVRDLPHIVPDDREYVAAEMSAFLLAWLASLRCPVIDGPSPGSLCGCGRTPWDWRSLARALGVPHADCDSAETSGAEPVTVIDGQAIGPTTPRLRRAALRMARAARRRLVTLRFTPGARPAFVAADPIPAVGSAAAAKTLLTWFERLR